MPDEQVRVTFEPHGRAVFVLPGTKILEAAARAAMTLETPCGAAGTCGKCRVRITSGAGEPTEADEAALDQAQLADGWRLACRTVVVADTVVAIPENSLLASTHRIVTATEDARADVVPAVRKVYVELDEPTLEDAAADLLRLERSIGHFEIDLAMLRRLGGLLRAGDFKGTAVLADHRLIDFEKGDTTACCYGLAFDVGTTTLVGALMDLNAGAELAVASTVNPQVSFGDDVLTRISRSGRSGADLNELRDVVIEAIERMIDELCEEAGVQRRHIYEASFAGNTTMEHLLCGVDVTQLGHLPFAPVYARGLTLAATDMGLSLHENARAFVFPVIGGFVGGDTVAGMLTTGLLETDETVLMIDIGTNGEIVLAAGGEILAASTAAGPAFEGARISCGMRAVAGAIEKVLFDDDVHCSVIGNIEAVGICGSGLIDLTAGLLSCGIVTDVGRMLSGDELDDSLSDALRARVSVDDAGQPLFTVVACPGGPDVTITQRDLREIQLGTGAIRAGISILLRRAGLKASDLSRVLIAGGFGSFIRRNHAQRIGLLPSEVEHQRIRYIGNASLGGAKWALISTEARARAEQIARKSKHVELSTDTNFQMEFAEAMIFPSA